MTRSNTSQGTEKIFPVPVTVTIMNIYYLQIHIFIVPVTVTIMNIYYYNNAVTIMNIYYYNNAVTIMNTYYYNNVVKIMNIYYYNNAVTIMNIYYLQIHIFIEWRYCHIRGFLAFTKRGGPTVLFDHHCTHSHGPMHVTSKRGGPTVLFDHHCTHNGAAKSHSYSTLLINPPQLLQILSP